jgi:hypothetical protein
MNNSNQLRHHKIWLALGWVWIAVIIYLSLRPEPIGDDGPWTDKLHHVFAYLMLMLWFGQLFQSLTKKTYIALGLIVMGIAIEFAQEQTGYRHFEFFDMVAGGIGVLCGLLLSLTPLGRGLRLMERVLGYR